MRFAFFGLSVVVLALLATSPVVSAISLTDYKFPESTSQQAYLIGAFNSSDAKSAGQTGYNVNGTGTYELNHRSLPFTYKFFSSANAAVERASTTGADRHGSYDLLLRSNANKYLRESSNTFGYGSSNFEYKAAPGATPFDPYWDITVGAGIGRTIDATVLKQAIRMNEDFIKYGVVKTGIPDDALLELAGIIDRKSEYQSRYGNVEYRKYWYEDMEDVVRKSGVLKGESLGAIGIIRIQEVLDEPTGVRSYGWEARAGLGVVVSDFSGNNGDPILEGVLDWARPAGIQMQFTDHASLHGVFSNDAIYTLSNQFQVYYEVSNRIHWDNRLLTAYEIPTGSGADNTLTVKLTSAYILYVANTLDFTPSFVYNRVDDGSSVNWDWSLSGNITYRLR